MILDDEVQKMRSLGLDRRIGGLSEDALIEIAQDGQKAVSALLPEKISRLFAIDEVRPQQGDALSGLFNGGKRPPSCPEGSVSRPSSYLWSQRKVRV